MSAAPKTILVAEDDAASRELIAELLRVQGFEVVEVANGAEALAWLGQRNPDLVVVDVQMLRLGGYEVLRRLRQQGRQAPPVLAVTAHAMRGDRERALQAGFDGYLAKPVIAADLRQRVKELLARAETEV